MIYSLLCGSVLTLLTIIRYWDVLFPPKHVDAWPVTLAPMIFMPVGGWVVEYLKPRSFGIKTASQRESTG